MCQLLIFLCVLTCLCISSTFQNLLISPETITIVENEDVNVSCMYTNLTTAVELIIWYEEVENKTTVVAVTRYSNCTTNLIADNHRSYILGCEKNNLFNLTLKKVSRGKHKAVLTCSIRVIHTRMTSENEAVVNVNVPVEYINISAPNESIVEVNENNTITILCSTSPSRPTPNVTCFVRKDINDGNPSYIGTANHSEVQDDNITTTISFLQYTSRRRHNGHSIFCSASNLPAVVVVSNRLQLNVKYPPAGPPTLDNFGPDNKYAVIEHHKVTLPCYSSGGNPLAQLQWTCNEHIETTTKHISNHESTKAIISWNASRDSNTSCYCSSTHILASTSRSEEVEVNVLYPPNIPSLTATYVNANRSRDVSNDISVIHIVENKTVAFSCSSDSAPPPRSVSWTRPQSSTSGQNVIKMIKRHQNGTYYCQVINVMKPNDGAETTGNATRSIDVSVLYPPSVHKNTTVTAIEGTIVSVPCIKEYGNPTYTTVNWIPTSDEAGRHSVLFMANVSRNDDNIYICTVNYTMRPSFDDAIRGNIKRQIHLEVVYKAVVQLFFIETHGQNETVTVTENDTVIFSCLIDSKPQPSASIRFQDGTLDSLQINGTVSTFTHSKVECTDAGSYTCSGLNEYNNGTPSEMNLTLFVKCPPRLSPLVILYETVTSSLNDRATLNYTAFAFPIPGPSGFKWEVWNKIHWLHLENSSQLMILSSELESKLIFLNVSSSDYGQYRLRVSNGFPDHIQNFYLVQTELSRRTEGNSSPVISIVIGCFVSVLTPKEKGQSQRKAKSYGERSSRNETAYEGIRPNKDRGIIEKMECTYEPLRPDTGRETSEKKEKDFAERKANTDDIDSSTPVYTNLTLQFS